MIRQFPQFYPIPSELDQLDPLTGKNAKIEREPDRVFTDVMAAANGDVYLAGYQTPGHLHPSPIPAKVKLARTTNLSQWTDLTVDYRAVARRVWLASPESSEIWAATDTGMILKLEQH